MTEDRRNAPKQPTTETPLKLASYPRIAPDFMGEAVREALDAIRFLRRDRDLAIAQLDAVIARLQWSNINGGTGYVLRGTTDLTKLLADARARITT